MSFYDPEILDPAITPFSQCRFCKKLIRVEIVDNNLIFIEGKCPHCEVFLDETDLINGFVKDFTSTQALASTQKIISFDLAVIPFICVSLLSFWMEFPIWFRLISTLPYLSPLLFCVKWFRTHYWQNHLIDDEYLSAVKDVKNSLVLWSCANIFCLILLLF